MDCLLAGNISEKCVVPWRKRFQTLLRQVSYDKISLVLGTGSWYNRLKTVDEHFEYTRTIVSLANFLRHFVRYKRTVIWVDLPRLPSAVRGSFSKTYGYNLYEAKNRFAYNNLSPRGIIYLNTTVAIGNRRIQDPSAFVDNIHMCNPGKSTIPKFICERILHIIAMQELNNFENKNQNNEDILEIMHLATNL
jgi:hypothetical protein